MTTFKTQPLSVAQNLTSRLEDIVLGNPMSIRAYVAREAINYCDDSPSQMFADLHQGGCLSGTIPSLITYADTHKFFNQYYDEIEAMREAFEDNTGEPLRIKGDLKNWLAWFAFEQVAFQLAEKLNF